MRYSGSYELLHKAVSCTYKISSCGLTCNLPFWVPMVNLNKYLVEYRWLTKLTHYVMLCSYIHISYIPKHIHKYLLFYVLQ